MPANFCLVYMYNIVCTFYDLGLPFYNVNIYVQHIASCFPIC